MATVTSITSKKTKDDADNFEEKIRATKAMFQVALMAGPFMNDRSVVVCAMTELLNDYCVEAALDDKNYNDLLALAHESLEECSCRVA